MNRLNPMSDAPKDGRYVILFGLNEYTSMPYYMEMCNYVSDGLGGHYWCTHEGTDFAANIAEPAGWLLVPKRAYRLYLVVLIVERCDEATSTSVVQIRAETPEDASNMALWAECALPVDATRNGDVVTDRMGKYFVQNVTEVESFYKDIPTFNFQPDQVTQIK